MMSDTGGSFVSEKFKEFCRNLKIEQAVSSSYYILQGQKACIKFIKQILKKYSETNSDMYLALLQMRSTPARPGLPSPATSLKCPIRGIMPVIHRVPINTSNDDDHYEALMKDMKKLIITMILSEIIILLEYGFTIAVQWEDWGAMDPS